MEDEYEGVLYVAISVTEKCGNKEGQNFTVFDLTNVVLYIILVGRLLLKQIEPPPPPHPNGTLYI